MSGKITANGFKKEGGNGLNVLLDNGSTKPLSELSSGIYKKYTALVKQTGTSIPTATILENDLSETPTYGRTGAGVYTINTVGDVFIENKTFFIIHGGLNRQYCIIANRIDANQVILYVQNISTGSGVDSILPVDGASIEIRVYN
jgi:hypothetical protein